MARAPIAEDAAAAAPAPAPIDEREAAATQAGPLRLVTGRVLGDPRAPVAGAVVLAFCGKPGDRSGFSPLSMMAQDARQLRPEDLAFVTQGEVVARAQVGADGAFAFETRERHLRLGLEHDLYGLAMPEIVAFDGETTAVAVLLQPYLGGCLRGRALGAAPQAVRAIRATVEPDMMAVIREPQNFLGMMLQVRRDADYDAATGEFVLRAVLASGAITLTVEGDEVAGRLAVGPLQPGETREVALPLLAASSLAVLVRDEDDAPVAGARIALEPESAHGTVMAQMQAVRAHTDQAGRATLRGLLSGAWRLEATARGHLDATANVVLPDTAEVTLRMALGGEVSGTVVDADGAPVADARVDAMQSMRVPLLGDMTEQLGLDVLASIAAEGTPTDAKGRFRITGIDGDEAFQLVAAHPAFAAGIARNVRRGDRDVTIVLPRAGAVTGRVVAAEDGSPLSAFEVEVQTTMFLMVRRPVRTIRETDRADGSFRIEGLPPGDFTVLARATGRSERQADATLRPGAVFEAGELRLPRGATVRGTVRDPDGNPVVRASVRPSRGGLHDNPMLAMLQHEPVSARTDEQGRYELLNLPPGRLQLVADAPGFAAARSARIQLAAGVELHDVDIALDHGGSIEGRVLVAEGEQADEFLVVAQEQQTQKSQSVQPGQDGAFRIDNLDPGRYQVQAMHPVVLSAMQGSQRHDLRPGRGFDLRGMLQTITEHVVSKQVVVRAGAVAEVELDASELGTGVRLELQVRVGRDVLREGLLEVTSLADGRLRTAFVVDGKASIGSLQPGDLRIQVRGGLMMTPIGAVLDLAVPKGTDHHRAVLELPGGELHGRVVDLASGAPLRAVLVRLLPGDVAAADDLLGTTLSDEHGEFAFRGLQPGRYGLVAADVLQRRTEVGAASRLEGIEVADGQTVRGLVLRAQAAAGVTVTVTDELGAPVPGAMVLAVDADGRPLGGFALAVAGGDGRAVLGGLPRGLMRAVARAPGLAPDATAVFEAVPGDALEAALTLRRGTRVVLDVVSRAGLPLQGADVAARCNRGPWFPALLLVEGRSRSGQLELGRLAPGAWEFRISHPATGTFTVQRSIAEGAAVTVLAAPQ